MGLVVGIILGLIVFFVVVIWLTSWGIHISMVNDCTDKCGYGTLSQFKGHFESTEWHIDTWWDDSIFDRKNKSKMHAGIIEFNGIGMKLYPYAWMVSEFMRIMKVREIKKPKLNYDWN